MLIEGININKRVLTRGIYNNFLLEYVVFLLKYAVSPRERGHLRSKQLEAVKPGSPSGARAAETVLLGSAERSNEPVASLAHMQTVDFS